VWFVKTVRDLREEAKCPVNDVLLGKKGVEGEDALRRDVLLRVTG